ncbi:MAG: aminotransferase class I/II-fold pyridoxal phosphate-dependent enzyme [Clostridia bacterium]|nr:aminotransferase class I/II-fold pyridoxal phosphate-dependent enzyme [Clostridia bacterium]
MDGAISLGIGEPDFVTPWHIRDAGIRSLEKGQTYYTANSGLKNLRNEICNYFERRFNLSYNENEVLVTVGGSEAIDLCIRALVSEGDEVLIPEPCFVCYDPCVRLAHGIPVPIVTEEKDDFILTPEKLKEKITPKTKLLILPFPNNPTGAIMDKEQIEAIADVLKDTNIAVLSDEIYGELTYGKKHFSIANVPEMKDRTIIVGGFSKAYAMTGWRLGFAVGNNSVISAMTKVHQFAIMSAPTTSQYAAIEALKNGDADIEEMASQYDLRRRYLIDRLNKMGLKCFEAKGAFYVFPSIKITGLKSEDFCKQLLEKKKVAVIPGTAFGESGEGHIRISYAYSIETITKALDKIEEFLKELGVNFK